MVLLDHGNGVLSHVQCGFNFFNPHGHEGSEETRHTISIVGSRGSMGLVGYDWEPLGVDLATEDKPQYERHATDAAGYVWQQGASLVANAWPPAKSRCSRPSTRCTSWKSSSPPANRSGPAGGSISSRRSSGQW